MKINVKAIVAKQTEKLKEEIEILKNEHYEIPKMVIFQVGNNYASNIYVKNKVKKLEDLGITTNVIQFDENVTKENLKETIMDTCECPSVDGAMLQLPLPDSLKEYEQEIIDVIPERKDVDRLTTLAQGKIMLGDISVLPCTVQGVLDIMSEHYGNLESSLIAIFGRSKLVGMPLSVALTKMGATPIVFHTQNLTARDANFVLNGDYYDIAVSAVGVTDFIDVKRTISFNVPKLLIDVGINRNSDGKLCGDITNADILDSSDSCHYTPVPGGVGLMTVLNVASNLNKLIKRRY
jgi:methylenetetrahydrofolate dehydrogenase (NADP+)/methenyltetrahydrofolate cyclohydrolase